MIKHESSDGYNKKGKKYEKHDRIGENEACKELKIS